MVLEKSNAVEKQCVNNPLEQFVLLAKGAKGAAAAELIRQALDAAGVYVFGELLDMPNIQELANDPTHGNIYELLQLFAHGTYKEYLSNADRLPPLSDVQRKKLQHLTIVSLAAKMNCIPYTLLLEEIDIRNVRDLEDLIIDAIYANIIRGKLDQKNSCLEVDFAIGRDIKEDDLIAMIDTLNYWCNSCETVLAEVDTQIRKANAEKTRYTTHRTKVESNVDELKRKFKDQPDDAEELGQNERAASNMMDLRLKKPAPKQPKIARGSGKFWPHTSSRKNDDSNVSGSLM